MRLSIFASLSLAFAPAAADPLETHLWRDRPVLVFAADPADPRLARQQALFDADRDALDERDIVVIVDTSAADPSALRRRYAPAEFTVILVGKDGGEKFRRNEVVVPARLLALIDTMPMRRREMREGSTDVSQD